jgi:hypothetical protein
MGWKIEFIQDHGIVLTTVSGIVTLDDIKKISGDAYKKASGNDANKLFSDYRKASLHLSISDIMDLPHTLWNLARRSAYRSAIVYSVNSKNKPNYDFFNTRCFNSSHYAKVFTDYDEAYHWLIDDTNKTSPANR